MLELWLDVFLPLLPGFYGSKFKAFLFPFFRGKFLSLIYGRREIPRGEKWCIIKHGGIIFWEKENTITELALPEKKRGTFWETFFRAFISAIHFRSSGCISSRLHSAILFLSFHSHANDFLACPENEMRWEIKLRTIRNLPQCIMMKVAGQCGYQWEVAGIVLLLFQRSNY